MKTFFKNIKNIYNFENWIRLVLFVVYCNLIIFLFTDFSFGIKLKLVFNSIELLLLTYFFSRFLEEIICGYLFSWIFLMWLNNYDFFIAVDSLGYSIILTLFLFLIVLPCLDLYDFIYGDWESTVSFYAYLINAEFLFLRGLAITLLEFIINGPFILSVVILFAPLFSFFICAFGGRFTGSKYTGVGASFMMFISAFSAFLLAIVHPWIVNFSLERFSTFYENRLKVHTSFFRDIKLSAEEYDGNMGQILSSSKNIEKLCYDFLEFINTNDTVLSHTIHHDQEIVLNFGKVIAFSNVQIDWLFKFDNLAILTALTVALISFFVHLYSCDYLAIDPHNARFFAYLSLFTFFMIALVTSFNFFVFYISWEGVGLCSFLLISFWFDRVAAVKAGIKALLVNKIGDLFLLTAISLIYLSTKTLDFDIIFNSIGLLEQSKYYFLFFNVAALDLICILFVLAACVKSAQLFFHIWLADAMEGPTPVSALLHAATMVTAGVFLLIRFSFIIEWSPVAMNLIVYFGAVTILFSGVIGLFQYDIKKIIAYSTCSQLGFMFLACGLSGYTLALYHFFNHAFFKALLFLSAGIIIHNLKNEQDIRKMGGLFKLFPFTFTMFLISSLSLSGFPFFAGYFSKDSILMLLYARAQLNGEFIIIYYLIMISLFITCFYSFKIIYYVFINKINVNKNIHLAGIKENLNFFTAVPMFSLAVLSVLSGALFKDYFIGGGANFFYEASIFIKPDNVNYFLFFKEQRLITLFIIVLSYTICILFSRYKYAIFEKKWFKSLEDKRRIYTFFIKKAAFDDIYNIVFNSKVYFYSRRLYEVFEKGLLLLLGPEGLYNNLKKISLYIKKKFNDGSIESLIFHFLLSVFFVLLVVFLNI